jgi:hypothetical protein
MVDADDERPLAVEPAAGHPFGRRHLLYAIVVAIVSGAIVEGILQLLGFVGLGAAADRALTEALDALRGLTPLHMAQDYLTWVASFFSHPPPPAPHDPSVIPVAPIPGPVRFNPLALFLPFVFLLFYPFHLIATDTWAGASIDLAQFLAGVLIASFLCSEEGPLRKWRITPRSGLIESGFKSIAFVVLVFACTALLSLIFLVAVIGVTEVVSFAIPSEHGIALTYGAVIGGSVSFVSHQSLESVVHEWLSRSLPKQ